jgi:hypothetical protein
MTRLGILTLTWLVLAILGASSVAARGPGEAAGGPRPGQAAKTPSGRADFKVVVWYRRNDPLASFQYQVYDVRKGEYTEAVEAWTRDIPTKYPAYLVVVRPVDLSRVPGATEKLKVGSVIHRELLIAAASAGVILGEPLRVSPGPYAGPSRVSAANRPPVPLQPDRSFLNPSPTTFPVPIPFPRPHP